MSKQEQGITRRELIKGAVALTGTAGLVGLLDACGGTSATATRAPLPTSTPGGLSIPGQISATATALNNRIAGGEATIAAQATLIARPGPGGTPDRGTPVPSVSPTPEPSASARPSTAPSAAPTEAPKPSAQASASPTEAPKPSAAASAKPEASAQPGASADFDPSKEPAYKTPATKKGNLWQLDDSDNNPELRTLPAGFTPDKDLKISDIQPKSVGDPSNDGDFQAFLNTPHDGYPPLAGYTDGTNDYNQYYDHKSAPQVPAYSWMIHTGFYAELPGIGRLEGSKGKAVAVLIINRDKSVYRFPDNSVTVVADFQGWGRIWDGQKNVDETERRLVGHYLNRLGNGVPETGFIGQCDQAEQNCDSVLTVSVDRVQWGNNADGSPRYQFRLIRAETIDAKTGQVIK